MEDYAMKDNPHNQRIMAEVMALLESDQDADISNVTPNDRYFVQRENIRMFECVTVCLAYYHNTLHLMDICVDEARRGESLGSQALKRVLAIADKLHLPVALYARSHSRSRLQGYALSDWYERHGFLYSPSGHVRAPAVSS